ncbi:hypothetical protein OSB04_025245 [Centaurea solstitialis]|uniref:Integrase catalytic domain-containing protein n=1 Tax=Centaurea solstitialis TaxID=347529 RepID=A0AA38SVA9_9ASTR|nr:hypothetical protein OSB04_025245 [Centaurea solstitialis]
MTKSDDTGSSKPIVPSLHPAYSVSNIQSKIRTLDGTKVSYTSWVKLFKFNAIAYKVLNHIDGSPQPASTDMEYAAWKELDALVSQWIYSTLSDDLLTRVLDMDATAHDTWLKLEKIFLSNKQAKAGALETQLVNLTLAACSSVDDYCQQLKNLANQLADVDQPVNDKRLVLQLVRGLSQEFDTTAQLIRSQQADWDLATTMLRDEVIRKEARQQQSTSVLVAPTTQTPAPNPHDNTSNPNPNPNPTPTQPTGPPFCGRGRGRNQYRGRGGRGRGFRDSFRAAIISSMGMVEYSTLPLPHADQLAPKSECALSYPGYGFPPTAPTGYDALSPSDLSAAFNNMQLNFTDPSLIMDTGAEKHVTDNRGMIKLPDSSPTNTKLLVGNGHLLPIEGSGTGFLPLHNRTYILPNIFYSPHIIKNLLSVLRFTRDNSVSVEFDPFSFSVKDLQTGRLLSRHNSSGNLYPVTPPTLPPQACFLASTSLPWHDRLGHPGAQVLDVLSRRFNFPCNHNKNSKFCHSCHLSNSKRFPFYESNSFTFTPFDIIHCDLWTSPILSKTGFKYYMVLIDNFSNFVWVYPLKYKSETFPTFTKFHRMIATQFHRNIKTFQCDIGGEFDNHAFKSFAQQHGLLFRFSCPQTSSQNGRSERMIRRLNDILRSLLIHAHLPPSFWVEAPHTATYLHNILPSKRLNYFTPTFALYLRHPTYDHLRVFGCACYPNTSATQPHKLHPRAIRCIFLGYPPDFRGYRCFDPTTGKVSISRHVTFDETVFPYSKPTPTSSYSFLDDDPPPGFSFSPRPSPPPKPLIHSTSPFPFHYNRRPKPAATAASSLPHPRSAALVGQPPSSAAPSATGQPSAAQTALPQPIHPPTNTHPMTTRSKARHTLLSTTISPVPTSYHKAFADPHWLRAMQTEFSALKENDTWDLVPRPVDRPVIRCMWLFRHKFKSDGSLERYKARLVVNGKSQTVGIDCEDTFSPVVKPVTIRTVLSVAVSRLWPIHQLDVKNAFLHGHLNEIVYMQQPPGFVDRQFPNFVCRLKKSLYGLKQAPRAWYTRFATYILSHGFRSSVCDNSLFIYTQGTQMAYLLLYVDDIVITASSDDLLQTIIRMLSREFAMTDLGKLHHFLGIKVTHNSNGLFLDQSQYAKDIISRASMSSCKPCTTPVDLNAKLSATDGPLFHDPTLYRSLAGALQYLTFTRPDISYAVQQVCLFMHEPHEPHFAFLKRIIRYLQGTLSYGIRIVRSTTISLVAYCDADWGGCPDSRRSTSGYRVFFGDNLISWSSKRQSTVSRSSAEAEYRGVANAVAEATWVRNLLLELQLPLRQASVVYCDNVSAVYLSDNPVQHQRTKHIEIDIHFVREKVRIGHIRVLHVPSSLQYADIFTKGLPRQLFESFRSSLSVCATPAQTAGES